VQLRALIAALAAKLPEQTARLCFIWFDEVMIGRSNTVVGQITEAEEI
jgi:hypothetical protein